MAKHIDFDAIGGMEHIVDILEGGEHWCIACFNPITLKIVEEILEYLGRGPRPDDDDVVSIVNPHNSLFPFILFFYVRRTLLDSTVFSHIIQTVEGTWISPEQLEGEGIICETSGGPDVESAATNFAVYIKLIQSQRWRGRRRC